MDCPVYTLFCLRDGKHYRFFFEKFADRIELPRAEREARLNECAARYARRLEYIVGKDPYQWYNFFDFWA
jgi:predicted LPLAT superfamily acyltransferase